VLDAFVGEYLAFYEDGRPYERRHYIGGHEGGLQQSWTTSGEVYLNYDARNGRRYGLVNAKPCETTRGVVR
jgi:antitoxin component YwqK of YwqJK toxin-antitoxin module